MSAFVMQLSQTEMAAGMLMVGMMMIRQISEGLSRPPVGEGGESGDPRFPRDSPVPFLGRALRRGAR